MSTPQVVIEPKKGWQVINFRELKDYRDLFKLMILRDVTVLYKQTVLGFAWAILNPLITMVVFTVIFGKLVGVDTGGVPYPIFSFAALVPWTYFSQAVTGSTNSLISMSGIFTKVYFPRLIIPLTPIFAKLIDFAIAFGILIIMMLFYHESVHLTWNILVLPFLLLIMVLTAAGVGMLLSAMAVQFRDIKFAVGFFIQILMYATPVVYSASRIPEQYRILYGIFPMAGVIEGFRSALIGQSPMPWDLIITGTITAIIVFLCGALYFRRSERVFADVA
ncbi:MAG: ABC transporter permease [Bacteroidota bacterium]|nr:ABC transporter permease [Bacteroidota bacterium]